MKYIKAVPGKGIVANTTIPNRAIKASTNDNESVVRMMAREDYECGHPVEDYTEFAAYLQDEGITPTEALYSLYMDEFDEMRSQQDGGGYWD